MMIRYLKVFFILQAIISFSGSNSGAIDQALLADVENSHLELFEPSNKKDPNSDDSDTTLNTEPKAYQFSKAFRSDNYQSPFIYPAYLAAINTRAPPRFT